tara:strand:+ start:3660 stop:3965 length:306 start_codon:yes stop_codon:yes gene_type:complete
MYLIVVKWPESNGDEQYSIHFCEYSDASLVFEVVDALGSPLCCTCVVMPLDESMYFHGQSDIRELYDCAIAPEDQDGMGYSELKWTQGDVASYYAVSLDKD